jgi:uncharacterized protein (TIGR02145 family)
LPDDPTSKTDPTLSVDKTSIAAAIAAGSYTIAVTSDSAWTAAVNATWCTVSPASGKGDGTVTVSVTENPGTTQRTATVTVTRGTLSKQVSVTQAADPTPPLAVNPATIEVAAFDSTYTVEVTSIATWSSEVNAAATSWCTITPDWAAGNRTVTISVADNPDTVPRSALITLTSGTLKKEIVVNQVARTLKVNLTGIEATGAAGAYPITVTSTAKWTVSSTATWYTMSSASGTGNGTVTVNVVANSSVQCRKAVTVTFTSGTLTQRVTVNQASASSTFTVDAANMGTPAADGALGTITNTGGSNYGVRSMGGTWWMVQNADKQVYGCTYNTIDRAEYGLLYSWNCASSACPSGWSLPTDADFTALSSWLTSNSKWSEWNTGSSLAGRSIGSYVFDQGSYGYWWSSSSSSRYWYVVSGNTSGSFDADSSNSSFSVRCRKSQ